MFKNSVVYIKASGNEVEIKVQSVSPNGDTYNTIYINEANKPPEKSKATRRFADFHMQTGTSHVVMDGQWMDTELPAVYRNHDQIAQEAFWMFSDLNSPSEDE